MVVPAVGIQIATDGLGSICAPFSIGIADYRFPSRSCLESAQESTDKSLGIARSVEAGCSRMDPTVV